MNIHRHTRAVVIDAFLDWAGEHGVLPRAVLERAITEIKEIGWGELNRRGEEDDEQELMRLLEAQRAIREVRL